MHFVDSFKRTTIQNIAKKHFCMKKIDIKLQQGKKLRFNKEKKPEFSEVIITRTTISYV